MRVIPNLSNGSIDFTQSFSSVTSSYAMKYTACAASMGIQAVYDVRWNVTTTPWDKAEVVMVGARAGTSTSANSNPLLYADHEDSNEALFR